MSPILIAILAVFCCIVGFVMGRITAAKSKPEFTGDCDLLRRIEYEARMRYAAKSEISWGDMEALVYGSSGHVRQSGQGSHNTKTHICATMHETQKARTPETQQ